MSSVSIVIPAYNEAATLDDMLGRSVRTLQEHTQDWEIVIADDGSTDETPARIEEWFHRFPDRLRCIRHPHRKGLAATFEELYRNASKDVIFFVHGDGQYPPESLKDALPLLSKHDIVLLAREHKYYGPWRWLLSAGYRLVPMVLFGIDLVDTGCSKCMKRSVIEETPIRSRGIFAEAERVIRAVRNGRTFTVIHIPTEKRRAGKARGGNPLLGIQATWDAVSLFIHLRLLRRTT